MKTIITEKDARGCQREELVLLHEMPPIFLGINEEGIEAVCSGFRVGGDDPYSALEKRVYFIQDGLITTNRFAYPEIDSTGRDFYGSIVFDQQTFKKYGEILRNGVIPERRVA